MGIIKSILDLIVPPDNRIFKEFIEEGNNREALIMWLNEYHFKGRIDSDDKKKFEAYKMEKTHTIKYKHSPYLKPIDKLNYSQKRYINKHITEIKSLYEIYVKYNKLHNDIYILKTSYHIGFVYLCLKYLKIGFNNNEDQLNIPYKLIEVSEPSEIIHDYTSLTYSQCLILKEHSNEIKEDEEKVKSFIFKVAQEKKLYESWINEQNEFLTKISNNYKEYGMYFDYSEQTFPLGKYKDVISGEDYNFKIPQLNVAIYCDEENYDYIAYKNTNIIPYDIIKKLQQLKFYIKDNFYEELAKIIIGIRDIYNSLCVIFGDSYTSNSTIINSFHFKLLKDKLIANGISVMDASMSFPSTFNCVIVVELLTTEKHMLEECINIIKYSSSFKICYISIAKAIKREEMEKIIEVARIKKEEEEKKKRLEQEEQERIRRIEQERKKRAEKEEQEAKVRLINDVKYWPEPSQSSLKCFSLYNYYPTNCEWPADEHVWEIRNLIWDFKANPNKPMSEDLIIIKNINACNKIIPDIIRVLNSYFDNDISKLTLVCIPASNQLVTERRYKHMAQCLCNSTGMTNGFSYVNVVADATPKHLGGTGNPKVVIDKQFFINKNVLLFDDIITRGSSMNNFSASLLRAGATVICGMSIGVTKHEREDEDPIYYVLP